MQYEDYQSLLMKQVLWYNFTVIFTKKNSSISRGDNVLAETVENLSVESESV
jgi:hypothetical protein